MSKTYRTSKSWSDEDDYDVMPAASKSELKNERRERRIRHEMKFDDLVRFEGNDPVSDADD